MESGDICGTIARPPCVNISTPIAGGVVLFFHHPLLFSFSAFVFLCHFQWSIKATVPVF